MESLFRYVTEPHTCSYLPDQVQRTEYEYVGALTPAEYLQRMYENWRRFGNALFRPVCDACQACQAIRIPVADFRPDRSQKRVRRLNEDVVRLRIGTPSATTTKLDLYDRYHAFQAVAKGWPEHPAQDASSYESSFVRQPFAVEEWRYYLGNTLIGVGYVDHLPNTAALAGGLSAIYYYYDPDEMHRSLGTWNVLSVLDEAARRGLPYVYLGYYVKGCASMEYKMRFAPNQLLGADGVWRDGRV
jgi:arginyl-tRNA--protein-N-Asp/Glu arginylyltransferase